MLQYAKKALPFVVVTVQLLAITLLVTGSDWLVYPLSDDPVVPLGTPLTWFLMAAFPYNFFWLMGRRPVQDLLWRGVRGLFGLAALLGLGWGFLAYALSGNWSYNFKSGNDNWDLFISYTTGLGILILAALLLWGVASLRLRWLYST